MGKSENRFYLFKKTNKKKTNKKTLNRRKLFRARFCITPDHAKRLPIYFFYVKRQVDILNDVEKRATSRITCPGE